MLPVHQTWSMHRVLSGSPLMGCQNAGLLGRWGNRASPPWLHTDLLLYQSNWTAADMGDNFLSGCTRMHSELVRSMGLTRGPGIFLSLTACCNLRDRGGIFHVVAAPLDYYAHTRLPRTDISPHPSNHMSPWCLPHSFPCQHYHYHPLVNYQHATEVISRNGCDRMRRCKAPLQRAFAV